MRNVPYLNLRAQHAGLKDELLAAVGRVLDSADFVLGSEVEKFERAIAAYCGTKYAIGVNSGTDALFLALKAYGFGPGDEVITAPNSFLASASVIVAAGAKPVFADIRADLNIDPAEIAKKITKKTKAIIPVHLTGKPADMGPINELANKYGLKVIEDAAQAIGAEYHGKKSGNLGNAGCFSTHPLKTLNACGDGGIVTTNDKELYRQIVQLRNIGLKNRDESDVWGYNSRLDSIQAAILSVKMKYLEAWTQARLANAAYYIKRLKGVVDVPEIKQNERAVFHTFVIQAERRDELRSFLKQRGIDTKIHYPIPIHLQKAAVALGYKKGDFPVTEKAADAILSLPVYQGLAEADLAYVVATIKEFYGRQGRRKK
jgi:dTDP-4-amino-4,6-dideoxygalactose transaminase